MTLPTREELFRSSLRALDRSREELDAARGSLLSGWTPVGSALPARAGDARHTALGKLDEAGDAIDAARAEILDALEVLA